MDDPRAAGSPVTRIGRLGSHHIARPRLTALVADHPVTLVEAGGGFGKTSLALEAAKALGVATAMLAVTPAERAPGLFAEKLRASLRGAGIAVPCRGPSVRAGEPLGAVLDSLDAAEETVLLIIDGVHHLDRDAAAILRQLAETWPARHRLLLLGRPLSAIANVAGGARIGAGELSFTEGEVEELAGLFDVELGPEEIKALRGATDGWAAALLLAARRLAGVPHPAAELYRLLERRFPFAELAKQQLGALEPMDRAAVVQLAHVKLLTPALVEALGGVELLERAVVAGVPFSSSISGGLALPGDMRELLAEQAPLLPETARQAARVYVELGEPLAAFDVLVDAGLPGAAAELLSSLGPRQDDLLLASELERAIAALPDDVIQAHPRVLLLLARASETDTRPLRRTAALERAAVLLEDGSDPALRREVNAELSLRLTREGRVEDGSVLASSVIADAAPEELAARSRALEALGRASAWWSEDADAIARAEPLLKESAVLAERAGRPQWAAQALVALAYGVYFAQLRDGEAELRLSEALELLPGRSYYRAVVLSLRADVLVYIGRHDEAEASIDEARAIGIALADDELATYTAWSAALLAVARGDRAGVVQAVAEVDSGAAAWREAPVGVNFLADAADLLATVGETELAWRYAERAEALREVSPAAVDRARAAVLSYCGEPQAAEELLARLLEQRPANLRHRVRLMLLRGYAAYRRGDPAAGSLAARAFDEAAELGHAALPLVRDRAAATQLLALASDAGSPTAERLLRSELPAAVRLLGAFEVTRGGRRIHVPSGLAAQLVKLVALGAPVGTDTAIEALWPEVEHASGRKRLRNVLNRLRATADVVAREGETLVLHAGYVDARVFEEEADRALKLAATGERARGAALARSALARYRGQLLPEDLYESWAVRHRERLERRYVDLLDLLARESEAAGDLGEAVRLLQRAIDADPHDEELYVRAGRLLLAQGRRLAAVSLAGRCERVFEELGLRPPPELRELVLAAHAAAER